MTDQEALEIVIDLAVLAAERASEREERVLAIARMRDITLAGDVEESDEDARAAGYHCAKCAKSLRARSRVQRCDCCEGTGRIEGRGSLTGQTWVCPECYAGVVRS